MTTRRTAVHGEGGKEGSVDVRNGKASSIARRLRLDVSPLVGSRDALSATGISGDYCRPSASDRDCALGGRNTVTDDVERGLCAVCEGDL
ncbi:hypothetical protein Taro_041291 [Colocasia esculenta]|uniref:Uncharacterized protein n=1 Tax=Colocasia esculenta TaxID=4460 RepID=A0A843WDZ9_COLES|nr:hypothetical protein [Colocasia esculenta]